MKTFEKEDIRFVEQGVDDSGRGRAVTELLRKRRLYFWCAVGWTTWLVGYSLMGLVELVRPGAVAVALMGFVAALHWVLCFKSESELRLLMIVGRLKSV